MTKFNPEGKEILTYGECLEPVMGITDQADADQYLADYIAFTEKELKKEANREGLTAAQICRINIGYYAGYYSLETQSRVQRLFDTIHPIFGPVNNDQC